MGRQSVIVAASGKERLPEAPKVAGVEPRTAMALHNRAHSYGNHEVKLHIDAGSVASEDEERGPGEPSGSNRVADANPVKVVWSRAVRQAAARVPLSQWPTYRLIGAPLDARRSLSSLELAIGELAGLAFFSAVGTFIEQNRSIEYYQAFYPDGMCVFVPGFYPRSFSWPARRGGRSTTWMPSARPLALQATARCWDSSPGT